MKIFCIHGNFQTSKVWQSLEDRLKAEISDLEVVAEDLYAKQFQSFNDWTEDFCERVEAQTNGEKSILLGYSLGGRLALHACLAKPDLWSGVIVVSGDPGSDGPDQKKLQLEKDKRWAERFRSEPLESLLAEWDDLPVFCSIPNPVPRNPEELDAEKTARLFEVFSKGRQRDLLPELSKLQAPPVLYLSGEKDEKYGELGEKLASSCPIVRHRLIPQAGHRIPWENPDSFVEEILGFMGS
jgi:2-succinyl-6-hydroxy-2,4-cyclohexadiene-1-carboxylate synthase